MCSKICALSARRDTMLHAMLLAYLIFVFSVQFPCTLKMHSQFTQFAASSVIATYFVAHQNCMALQQTVCCTSKLHIPNTFVEAGQSYGSNFQDLI
jgi:hypothetical protein